MTKKISILILSALAAVCVFCAAALTFGLAAFAEEDSATAGDGHTSVDHSSGWKQLTSSDLESDSGYNLTSANNYYVDCTNTEVTLKSSITINVSAGSTVTLCLNGHMLNAGSAGSAIVVQSGTLILCSCSSNTFYCTTSNAATEVSYSWSPNRAGSDTEYESRGLITADEGNSGNGGGVYVAEGAILVMYDIDISGNKTSSNGGGVYVASGGTFEMYSGSIFWNIAGYGGGGVYNAGTLKLCGGIVTGNTAQSGGGVRVYGGTATIDNGFVLYDNTATNNNAGNGIYLDTYVTSVTINGGFIIDDVVGTTTTLSIQGGYYPASACDSGAGTIYGRQLDTNKYTLLDASDLGDDSDLQGSDYASEVAYAVYTIATEIVFAISYADDGIVYDGDPVAYGDDFTVKLVIGDSSVELGKDDVNVNSLPTDAGDHELTITLTAGVVDCANKSYYGAGSRGRVTLTINAAVAYSPEMPEFSAECGTSLSDVAEGYWELAETSDGTVKWGTKYTLYYNISDTDAKNYIWDNVEEYNSDEQRLEYTVTLTVTHESVALEHKEGVAATCGKDGTAEYWYCELCNNYFSDAECTEALSTLVISKGHYNAVFVEAESATCTEDGHCDYYYCETCGKYFSDENCVEELNAEETTDNGGIILKATGHNSVEYVDAQEATYDSAGHIGYWYCEDCDTYFSDATATKVISADSVIIAQLTHVAEIVLLCVGGAICIGLAAILVWQINKKRRVA